MTTTSDASWTPEHSTRRSSSVEKHLRDFFPWIRASAAFASIADNMPRPPVLGVAILSRVNAGPLATLRWAEDTSSWTYHGTTYSNTDAVLPTVSQMEKMSGLASGFILRIDDNVVCAKLTGYSDAKGLLKGVTPLSGSNWTGGTGAHYEKYNRLITLTFDESRELGGQVQRTLMIQSLQDIHDVARRLGRWVLDKRAQLRPW
ncbi:hypothetical protein HPB52_007866 [Rhipicephalus sanguineus]|uniref:Uncharacterized protein n=1 Tax=Rhipicephalus sanguineus TaxID=34632 RepID=A0A9D4Q5A8_RHISA|nr:hypothetical protein HPB52_007866 [Rhipicephalus sanguineus]